MNGAEEQRRTEQGELIGVRTLRGFLKRTLADDAVADKVDELLFEHVVAGRYHPSVVAESLPGFLNDIVGSARMEDWQAIADELIAEARGWGRSSSTSRWAATRRLPTSPAARRFVGEPGTGAEVEVHFEGAIHGQENMRTLADRATHAPGGCWSATRPRRRGSSPAMRSSLWARSTFAAGRSR